MNVWITALAPFLLYPQIAAADQSPELIQQFLSPIALYPDAPLLGESSHPNQVEPDRSVQERSSPQTDQPWNPSLGALKPSPSLLPDLEKDLSPELNSLSAYDLWHLDGRLLDQPLLDGPMMEYHGWASNEEAFIGGPGFHW
jgi:hypothetical protein